AGGALLGSRRSRNPIGVRAVTCAPAPPDARDRAPREQMPGAGGGRKRRQLALAEVLGAFTSRRANRLLSRGTTPHASPGRYAAREPTARVATEGLPADLITARSARAHPARGRTVLADNS